MKLLKISLAILLFSFLGSMHNPLSAQEPNENLGSSAQAISLDQYLENGDFKTKWEVGSKSELVTYKASNDATLRKIGFSGRANETFKSLSLRICNHNNQNLMCLCQNFEPTRSDCISLSADSRNRGNLANYKILNTTIEPADSAYFKLESDGKLVIYSGTGGSPILELVNPW